MIVKHKQRELTAATLIYLAVLTASLAVVCVASFLAGCGPAPKASETETARAYVARCFAEHDYQTAARKKISQSPSAPADNQGVHSVAPGSAGVVSQQKQKTQSKQSPQPKRVQWLSARPAAPTKPILIHYTTAANRCAACGSMDRNTFADPAVIDFINANFHAVRVEWDGVSSFPVRSVPTDIVEFGDQRFERANYQPPRQYLQWLQQVKDSLQ